ncbi:PREDICTED: cyclic nucleotide-gated cation channel alpha-4 isoform X2 [Rhinopithecus bieti]|uniref:Cyclic nucleotide gated channel subunit alpha 4 n=1 Tax=Rhinopithecus bieti TaxID=61621 RepID=A0A2K6MAJ4_RHIBE|nr:PREDICTED: cyclic nucleotide-gated cation channel alpha-4 isoform X2 [Rhinopithecus bieti]
MERRTWPGPVVAAVLGEFRPPPSLLRRTSRAPPRATRSPRPRAPHVTARGRTTGQWRASSLAEPDQTRARSLVSWQRLNAGAGSSTAIRGRSTASPLGSAPSKSLPVLNPSGDYYYWWLNTMVFPVMYNLIILVCRACFPDLQHGYLVAWLVLDYTSDLLYLLDIVVRFHTGFLEQGILVVDKGRISSRYVRTWSFLLDLASLMPTDVVYLRLGPHAPTLRLNRFLRAPRLFEAFDRTETRTAYPNAFRIAKLMLYIFVVIHWNSCLYFALSQYLGFGRDAWVYPDPAQPGFERLRRQYLYSFYFSTLILTTVGDTPPPAREEEYLFMVGDFLLAVMGFATIMGSMSSVIYNMNTADAAFYPDHGLVKKYMKLQHVNRKLERRVIDWYQHLQINKKITNEIAILQHLPERLRAEVAVSVHLSTLSQVQIFQNCEASLLEELVLKLQPQTYSPGNMSGNRRTANIKSIGYSDLFCLSKEDLQEVLSEYPQAQTVMEEKGREILLKMNKLDMNAEAAEIALQEATESRLRGLDQQLDDLQTKFARLLAELESSALKIAYRVERLEWQTREWPMPEDLAGADDEGEPGEGTSKDEEGRATQEGPPGPE